MSDSISSRAAATGSFRIEKALDKSLKLFAGNLPIYLPLAYIPGIPGLFFPNLLTRPTPDVAREASVVYLGIFLVAYPLIQSVILHAAIQDMRGRPSSLITSMQVALSRFLPVLGTLLCIIVLIGLGFLLVLVPATIGFPRYYAAHPIAAMTALAGLSVVFVIVPFLILIVRYYVAIAACLVERTGPFKSLKRSASLTSGNRWRLFGLILLVGILLSAAGAAIGGVLGGTLGYVLGITGKIAWLGTGISVIRFVLSGFSVGYGAVLGAVVYHDLRVAKEGVDTDRIAAIFD